MGESTKDMTRGNPRQMIISFAIPLMLGNVFQQMYTVMDSVIVGRGIGVEALAALGASDRDCTGVFCFNCSAFWGKR